MGPSDAIQLAVLVILLALSAFFSSAETALTTVNRLRVRALVEEGDDRAIVLSKVIDDPGKLLSAILIGNNIVNISASSIATVLATNLIGSAGAGIATGVMTFLVLIFGEITPKTMASLKAEKIALSYAKIVYALMFVLTPLIFILDFLSGGILRLFGIDPDKRDDSVTEEDLRTIVEAGHEDGVLETEEHKMINNVFDFGDHQAKDIMVPRVDMCFLKLDATYEEFIEIYREEKFTRIPVYEETRDNVVGILNVKDLLLYNPKEQEFHVKDFLREAYYTYEFKNTSELMMEMRKNSISIAIVLDEYGATAGLVTLEDLLEEIVGDIRDEFDEAEAEEVQQLGEREYLVEGACKLEDLNDMIGLGIESEDYDSIGGIVIEALQHLPAEGEEVTTENGTRLVVEKIDKNRIEKVHIYLPEPKSKEEDEISETEES
ncbi:MAG: HlyC/CorC family transporter [Lachnospiraceae bacterium]|nr:HlyC/CorC family transporter [Lachnospiraceae bacterium]